MYSSFIKINKNFQTSVSLELDLNSEKKINEYIPTRDICDVLRKYIDSFSSSNFDRATTLVGPYGKGKSFLLLVLSYLISQDPKSKTYKQLISKIKKIDSDLSDSIDSFGKSGNKLLPVIVNSNYDNLNQAFMLALNEALKREEIKNIIPETTYGVCLDLIKQWNSESDDPEFSKKMLRKCQKEIGTSLDKIEMGLKDYSPDAYSKFVMLYNCVTHGMPFNPLINDDIVHVYNEVIHQLKNYGYNGIFIIFDEFSKFLESSSDAVSKNLKIIQDFAEAATRSGKNEQLHICCVTHKSLSLYKTSDKEDSFKTVEGRFKEIKFNRSLDENYQIISSAIENDKGAAKIERYIGEHKNFYEAVNDLDLFNSDSDLKNLIYGCFPLNPITVYTLIQLSELVAQNERTLFTFICDVDDNSLNTFINKNDSGLFNVDKIYDYFSPLLKREEGNNIRNIWYRAEGTLSRVEDPEERSIIKALAVIMMINEPDTFPASLDNLALSTMLSTNAVEGKVADLIDKGYLRKNLINNLLSFASSNNKEIEDQISIISQTKAGSLSGETVLNEINESKYLLPRRYNEQNKITRFYKVAFISEHQLSNMTSFGLFKESDFSDGIVLNLIRKKMSVKTIKEKYNSFKDNEVILKYPKQPINSILDQELLRYVSIQELLNKGGNDQVITSELELLLQETTEDIKGIINNSFESDSDFEFLSYPEKNASSFNELLSIKMETIYPKEIIFNNELVNKNIITSVYQKAVNNVLEDLINKRDGVYSETSPETTIKKSIIKKMDQPDVQDVIDDIKRSIIHAEKQKLLVSEIVDKYTAPPYGIRKGIIQLLLAECISELSDNVLLYFKNREIDLNAGNLVKAIESDSDYYLRCSKGTIVQSKYLDSLLRMFKIESSGNFRIDNKTVCDEFRKFFIGLPSIIKNASIDNKLGIKNDIIEYKKLFLSFNTNPYEVVFERPFDVFGANDYKEVFKRIREFVSGWENYLDNYKMGVVKHIKKSFEINNNTSLHMGLNALLQSRIGDNKPILNEIEGKIYSAIKTLSYDDKEAINALAVTVLGIYVEDWTKDLTDQLFVDLRLFYDDISNTKTINTATSSIDKLIEEVADDRRSEMGKLFQNSIENVLDEFGDSISSAEKISVLSAMLKKYL